MPTKGGSPGAKIPRLQVPAERTPLVEQENTMSSSVRPKLCPHATLGDARAPHPQPPTVPPSVDGTVRQAVAFASGQLKDEIPWKRSHQTQVEASAQ